MLNMGSKAQVIVSRGKVEGTKKLSSESDARSLPPTVAVTLTVDAVRLILAVRNVKPPCGGFCSSGTRLAEVITGRNGGREELNNGSQTVIDPRAEVGSPRTYV